MFFEHRDTDMHASNHRALIPLRDARHLPANLTGFGHEGRLSNRCFSEWEIETIQTFPSVLHASALSDDCWLGQQADHV